MEFDLSPIFESGSSNGYDIVDPNRIDPHIGTFGDFDTLARALQKRGMKLVCDVVPNHMGIKGKNKWWQDVLEHGPTSPYAPFFNIDWNPEKRELKNKILLPILGDMYGKSLFNQEIQLRGNGEKFWIECGGYHLPISSAGLTLIKEICGNGIDTALALFNGKKGVDESFDLLHQLLELQYYRLAYWLVAGQEINYRRFFNINELVAIHIEEEKVLDAHHELIFKWIEEGKVQGLRIDHPDGLYDPLEYFKRVESHHPPFVILEKILDVDESLPSSFPVQGTVGYEYLNMLNALFVQKNHAHHFTKIYQKFIGYDLDYYPLIYQRKKQFLKMQLESEIHFLGWKLDRLKESNRHYRDFTRVDLTRALGEIIACFPVYRTYIRANEGVSKRDRDYIFRAIENAKLKTPEINRSVYDYIGALLVGELQFPYHEGIDFTLRFQQLTAPIMAKGLEDSTFYIYNRFIALNEVGGNPNHFGISRGEFHQFNIEKRAKWPLGFLPSSTHDTKRSQDVRMRLDVLSELPKKWGALVFFWERENRKYKKKLKGSSVPDRNTEYFLYQTLLGIWPELPPSPDFLERVHQSMLKAIREAGLYY